MKVFSDSSHSAAVLIGSLLGLSKLFVLLSIPWWSMGGLRLVGLWVVLWIVYGWSIPGEYERPYENWLKFSHYGALCS